MKDKKTIIGIVVGLIILIIIILLLRGCTREEYTIKFDTDGGSIIESIKVKENDKIEKPSDPTKEGYDFAGWYYNDKKFDFNTKVKKNMTLKAKWKSDGTGIVLKDTDLEITVDDELTLEIEKLLKGLKKEDLIWESSDGSIVTVDKDGKIKALKAGKVTITVKTKDGERKATVTVTVKEKEQEQPVEEEQQTTATNSGSSGRRQTGGGYTPSAPAPSNPQPSNPQPAAPTYRVVMKAHNMEIGGALHYTVSFYRDGVDITGSVKGFVYNGQEWFAGTEFSSDDINRGQGSATIILNDNSKVSASVSYS